MGNTIILQTGSGKRTMQQAISATMALATGLDGGYYSGRGCPHNSNDNYEDICRSEGAKQFKRKKNRRKIAKASQKRNRRTK